MNDLTFPQEFEYIAYITVIDETKQIVVGYARFLLCCIWIDITVPQSFRAWKNRKSEFPPRCFASELPVDLNLHHAGICAVCDCDILDHADSHFPTELCR